MWLLNSCTWEMKEFISNKQAPPYAILSHTWGDEEVSFREWQYEPMKDIGEKDGFRKIKFCCQQAAADGLEWVWIDTCCIDKRSSAELSEAINSMFEWYKNAAVCYAYLSDILEASELDFAKSRWVTRGWTLQELIAPREIVFYSSCWEALGTRSQLSNHLAAITRIDERFLTGRSLDNASIAQRMSWAAKRTTSREEDMAYCLLGILNVNMPLIYGEGPKAFRRLQETLIREYPHDHSLFAWGKVVKQPSTTIYDYETIWGTTPIKHEPDRVVDEFLGLLADSPGDFEHSGQFVIAPTAAKYFYVGSKMPSVSNVIGRTAHVELPQFDIGPCVAFHVKYPPIVRMILIRHMVILCGQWDDSHKNFRYVSIPIADSNGHTSRTDEIVVGDTFTHNKYSGVQLAAQMRKFTISPHPVPFPRTTNLILRRHPTDYEWSSRTLSNVGISYIDGVISPRSSNSGAFLCFEYSPKAKRIFMIVVIRLNDLDHSHEDPNRGRECGRLRFGVHSVVISQEGDPPKAPLTILNKDGDSGAPATKEQFNALTFRTSEAAVSYCFDQWQDLNYKHDMALPRDEWSISITGIADIYVCVERVFIDDEYDSDDEITEDESHPFIDILDIVVKESTEKEDVVEENK